MKTRESGMPPDAQWESYFDAAATLDAMGVDGEVRGAADFGCGYGTFAIPAARRIQGTLYGFDIEPDMIAVCHERARAEGVENARFLVRDFVLNGTGLEDGSVDLAMLFNILHAERPVELLREAMRILGPHGRVAVTHWNHDPATPRGPSMDIRPAPADCRRWLEQAGFVIEQRHIDLPPYHYGITGRRP